MLHCPWTTLHCREGAVARRGCATLGVWGETGQGHLDGEFKVRGARGLWSMGLAQPGKALAGRGEMPAMNTWRWGGSGEGEE